jgi:hypothetical protein
MNAAKVTVIDITAKIKSGLMAVISSAERMESIHPLVRLRYTILALHCPPLANGKYKRMAALRRTARSGEHGAITGNAGRSGLRIGFDFAANHLKADRSNGGGVVQ